MCGITGIVGVKDSLNLCKKSLKKIEYRGKDGIGFFHKEHIAIGHALHSIVGKVKQPLVDKKNVFASNNEIYNWKKLNERYGLETENDSETMFKLLSLKGIDIIEEFDGPFAFAFLSEKIIYLARDIIGIKPMWYSHGEGLFFASEKKALEEIGLVNIHELNPRKILVYDIEKDRLDLIERKFFILSKTKDSKTAIIKKVNDELINAIKKRLPQKKFGLLFSGGIDSTTIALILKNLGKEFKCYTCVVEEEGMKKAEDLVWAEKVAEELDLDLEIVRIKSDEVESLLKKTIPLIEDTNVVKAEVGATFYKACEKASKDGCKVLFTGLGSEEIFAGYQRHRDSGDINKECVSGLLKMYERDLYRDDVIMMKNSIEGRFPFLDKTLVEYALTIPGNLKMKEGIEKWILREVALEMGLKEEIAMRKKRAAQYGSKINRVISKISRKKGYKYKSEYLRQFYPKHNLNIGAMVSSGKDSLYAAYVLKRQNYNISCMITIDSENQDSYMFHTPTIELVKMISKSTGIPLVEGKTKGNKEEELKDLIKTLKIAKEKYNLHGICTGAIFSSYQRDRIEKICDTLGLKIFSPLWHLNQESYMNELVDEGFKFIMTKVAAEGFDEKWLNKEITSKEIMKLSQLNEGIGLNVAGEGGEFESLVLDCPLYEKEIVIKDFEIIKEDKNTALLKIKKAELKSVRQ